jgi:hypothetical protein
MVVGAGVAAAIIGAPAAHADDELGDTPHPIIPVTPASLLSSTTDNLTETNNVLSQADLPDEFQGVLGPQTQVLDNGLDLVDKYEAIQAPLVSSDNPSLVDLGSLLFLVNDQQIEQASGAVLSATQAFDSAPSLTTEFGLLSADLQFLDTSVLDSLIPNIGTKLVEQLFGIGGSDAASSIASDLAATEQ